MQDKKKTHPLRCHIVVVDEEQTQLLARNLWALLSGWYYISIACFGAD